MFGEKCQQCSTEQEWLSILHSAVEEKGRKQVCDDIGYGKATLSLLLNGKYPAKTDKIRAQVIAKYGTGDCECPLLGTISLVECWRIQKMQVATEKCCNCKYNLRV